MFEKLRNEIEGMNADISVYLKDLTKNAVLFEYNADKQKPAASTIKVPVMTELIRQASKGALNLDKTVKLNRENIVDFSRVDVINKPEYSIKELMLWMIIASDNTATNELIDIAGMSNVNRLFVNAGLQNTALRRKMMDFEARAKGLDNLTTARDMAMFFEKLYRNEFFERIFTDLAMSILKRQRSRESLMRYICDDIELASKTGGLDNIENDVGIFLLPDGRAYILSVYVSDVETSRLGEEYIGRISLEVYRYFVGGNE